MNIFLRTFNDSINSKSGAPLPPDAPRRGTPEWLIFEGILINCLKDLGHSVKCQDENPHLPDDDDFTPSCDAGTYADKRFYVHQNKREKPLGNFFYMQMHMRELFTVDTNGWGYDHNGKDRFNPDEVNQEEATTFCKSKSHHLISTGISKCVQQKECSSTPPVFILVPLQIPRDYTIKHHSPVTVRYFVDSIMSWAEETETHVCIKMHPHNKGDYDLHQTVDEGARTSSFIHKVEGNINTLIKRSLGVFVINSGTGFESLLHGKPVATFGNCDYNKVTFNADLRRLNEARDFLYSYTDLERNMAYSFIYWYWKFHSYDVYDHSTPKRLKEYLFNALK